MPPTTTSVSLKDIITSASPSNIDHYETEEEKQNTKQSNEGQPAASLRVGSTKGLKEESMHATKNPSQGLKFVDVTPRYLEGIRNPAEQKSIRIHVMQDFLRQKKQPVDAIEPPAMAGTVSSHVHRFRIAKPRLQGDTHFRTISSQKVAMCSEQRRGSTPSRTSSNTVRCSGDLFESEMGVLTSTDRSSHCGTFFAEEKASLSRPRIVPNLPGVMARMDPFAKLPIDGSTETHEILDYYRTSYWSNSLAINPDGRWLSIAASDPALFHAQLCLVAQHQALMRGIPFPELYYYHRGMAISIVTSRLVHPVEAISDPTIGAVALLSNSDVSMISTDETLPQENVYTRSVQITMSLLNQTSFQNYFDVPPEVQHSHIKGLLSLVQLRGGLHTLSTNESIKRVVTWADLVHAAANDGTPCLGISKCNAGYDLKQLFPAFTSAGCPVRTMYPEQTPVPAPLKEVFETIRLLSIAQSAPNTVDLKSTVNRRILANVLYRVEYLLLDPLLLPLGVSEGQEEPNQSNWSDLRTPLFSASTAGALIFTYSCLRNLAIHSRPFQRLVTRLRLNLELIFDGEKSTTASFTEKCASVDQKTDSPSPANANPSLLLWLLMHGFKATLQGHRESDREWFVRRGATMCKSLNIRSLEELRTQINQVVAFKLQCVPATDAFWKAICDHHETDSSLDDI